MRCKPSSYLEPLTQEAMLAPYPGPSVTVLTPALPMISHLALGNNSIHMNLDANHISNWNPISCILTSASRLSKTYQRGLALTLALNQVLWTQRPMLVHLHSQTLCLRTTWCVNIQALARFLLCWLYKQLLDEAGSSCHIPDNNVPMSSTEVPQSLVASCSQRVIHLPARYQDYLPTGEDSSILLSHSPSPDQSPHSPVKIPTKWPSGVSKDTLAFWGFWRLFPCFWSFWNVPVLLRFLEEFLCFRGFWKFPCFWNFRNSFHSFRGRLFSHCILSEFTSMPLSIT